MVTWRRSDATVRVASVSFGVLVFVLPTASLLLPSSPCTRRPYVPWHTALCVTYGRKTQEAIAEVGDAPRTVNLDEIMSDDDDDNDDEDDDEHAAATKVTADWTGGAFSGG
eukprot:CAMPEP_0194333142 /NCGR_PEP_ID=MMETSP0171-20130528/61686_1 /TAXON_ID=218684 /ORGANISM="Corethron pennatum, Strain L29A3" /LENGTH=110 /DNA_ID=CAMNT_0039095271 /DNA_START=189 /DNA_END=518 /DNA_ORIENTATION=-